jgi:signal transduction histidine kinase
VTERQKAEQNLREMNIQLRGLSASLQDVREQERTRIARELHDELGQQLTGLKLDLSWLSSRVKEGRDIAFDKIDEMRRLLDIAISSVRRISTELRPVMLDDLGFAEAITWQLEEVSKRSGIEFTLDLSGKDFVKDCGLATALFRIVQESLTNITRYANAQHVDVKLFCDNAHLMLTIQDDGIGVAINQRTKGFGLVSMRERANALGGEFELISNLGSGTLVRVSFPLDAPIFTGKEA